MKMIINNCLSIYFSVTMLLSVDARSDEPLGLSGYQETTSRITRAGLRSGMAYSLLSELFRNGPAPPQWLGGSEKGRRMGTAQHSNHLASSEFDWNRSWSRTGCGDRSRKHQ